MSPRYTLTITDNEQGVYMTIGTDVYEDFKKKSLSGYSSVYELLNKFAEKYNES